MTFVPLDGVLRLLGQGANITETSRLLLLFLSSQASPYEEAPDWIKFTYTGERMGAYVAPASTYLFWYVLADGDLIFAPALQ